MSQQISKRPESRREHAVRTAPTPEARAAARVALAYSTTTPDVAAATSPVPSAPRRVAGSSGRPAARPSTASSAGDSGSSGSDPDPDMPGALGGRDR